MTNTMNINDRLAAYGVSFEGEQGEYRPSELGLSLANFAAENGRIDRVRWIGGDYIPGRGKCYDLSYVQGVLPDGRRVSIDHLPAAFLVPRRELKKELIRWAKEEGVFAKALGLLDDGNFSILG